jgi:hypothetical integral membrane protein (TIGR02206 family)
VFAAGTAALVVLRRRWRETPRAAVLDRSLAVGCFVAWVWVQAFGLLPWRYEAAKALPLHVCDLAGLVAPPMLWTGWRPLRTVCYFWGIGLSTQGFIQPDLQQGPNDPSFWAFWVGHVAVVGTALYDVAARGYRPTWRDYGVAVVTLAAYVAVVLPLDIVTGFNYGYVGRGKPGQPSVVDFLGPWPGRLLVISALAAAVLALMVLPWDVLRWWQRRERAGGRRDVGVLGGGVAGR